MIYKIIQKFILTRNEKKIKTRSKMFVDYYLLIYYNVGIFVTNYNYNGLYLYNIYIYIILFLYVYMVIRSQYYY